MEAHYFAALAALIGAVSLGAHAADETPVKKNGATKAEQKETVKPHLHLDEKGIPHSDPDKSKNKSNKKNSGHQHQRDAK